ncbi:MAG: hypothetical protein DRJ52_06945 [Thermoprotei archaeon]|nr:MAG: hypothetical protein DRJ52_06945 [Thermoprotei archaeon]RLE96808.1 MAG: hypothetical protein DRJ63_10045 [Thermoprotei archaeon]
MSVKKIIYQDKEISLPKPIEAPSEDQVKSILKDYGIEIKEPIKILVLKEREAVIVYRADAVFG